MKKYIAYCGLDCESCEARLATVNNDATLQEAYRLQGIAGQLLNMAVEDMRTKSITPLYLVTDHIGFYGHSGFTYARNFGIRYHDLPEGADDSFFLCRELRPGYLDGITGVYQTPQGYYVDDADVEEFDKAFPYKEKLKLPGHSSGGRRGCCWGFSLSRCSSPD